MRKKENGEDGRKDFLWYFLSLIYVLQTLKIQLKKFASIISSDSYLTTYLVGSVFYNLKFVKTNNRTTLFGLRFLTTETKLYAQKNRTKLFGLARFGRFFGLGGVYAHP